ncbi:protein-glutamine glutaminase family protein [Sorangium atrum]|uniref:Protein-glutamine glutaminase family protein n=1 Tax=Sorangium atrum TaxID=2995308 RepID=A0ABT5BUB8_9BACT|nr:protein-glutamine glutaminase family protein [Sorangium aterium]MDC0677741.1 protein-glutamine glutaminase family protein [Sorangium aterium]
MPEQAEFLRRIPWLAADNGCEERAEAAVYFFHQWDYPTPYFARVRAKPRKRLVFQTTNEPSRTVTWSHHVAPVVRVGGQLMILDVAIDFGDRALRRIAWQRDW